MLRQIIYSSRIHIYLGIKKAPLMKMGHTDLSLNPPYLKAHQELLAYIFCRWDQIHGLSVL